MADLCVRVHALQEVLTPLWWWQDDVSSDIYLKYLTLCTLTEAQMGLTLPGRAIKNLNRRQDACRDQLMGQASMSKWATSH